ncbi:hypothetical protein HMPREF0623_1807 [Pediococcus acidilactici DSM 20284]|uniref:Uncharacterized protein n=1 Tax=Pediococcus acidilactici DSM 20284 TaxID=862514 RepID=E0NIH6_PEDAC|nr:hypothetical protein HMPREF0623_1807 [Pediococcus acidilactici DSM 20284]
MEAEKELKLFWYIDFNRAIPTPKFRLLWLILKRLFMLNSSTMVAF